MKKVEIKVEGYEVIEKVVKDAGNSGRIYLPKSWVNKKVKVVLLEPIDEQDKSQASG